MSDQVQDQSSVNVWEDDGDDIWDEGDSISYDRAIAEREWSRLHETFGNTGYREGIEEGKEGTLQSGFNQGWSEGVNYGHELGRLRGLISPLLEYIRNPSKTGSIPSKTINSLKDKEYWIERAATLVKELTEIDIAKVFDKAYFDDGLGPSSKKVSSSSSSSTSEDSQQTGGSGCCGGGKGSSSSSSSNKDSCCKKDTPVATTDGDDASNVLPSQGCGSSNNNKGKGSCLSKNSNAEEIRNASLESKKDEWSSRPQQVISEYRSRAHTLLQEVGLESLLEAV
ncbi:hypothetical protein BGX28_007864 [Mortierella sp. GBA30]|nr:hypothetical protein BGX28_007864 [Mortierella sp. GBA30]